MSEDDGNPNKVFLGGLNYDSSEDSIKAHFEDNFGQVDPWTSTVGPQGVVMRVPEMASKRR